MIFPWLIRAGAALIAVSFFIPQVSVGTASASPFKVIHAVAEVLDPSDLLGIVAWSVSPFIAGALVLASRWRGPGPRGRGMCMVLFLGYAFTLSVLGSMVSTTMGPEIQGRAPSVTLGLLLFILPILLGGVGLSRLMGGASPERTASFSSGAIGLLIILFGLYMIDYGWNAILFLTPEGKAGTTRILPWAWLVPLGGALLAAGEALPRFRRAPRPALEPARDLPGSPG